MQDFVPAALVTWMVFCVALFFRGIGPERVALALVGGWAILPVAVYPASAFGVPYEVVSHFHALAVPTTFLFNKAIAIGLGCLVGVVLFDWPALRRLRSTRLDLPMLVWCLVPVASALANRLPLADGLTRSRSLALGWGVPYLLGRIYLADNESMRRFAMGLVVAGVLYAPLCLVEFATGPLLYERVYGPHPYRFDGASRFIGHRPLIFLEHGNQLGTWLATIAVAAIWLWRSGRLSTLGRVPGGMVALGLTGLCLLCQSHTSIVLTLVTGGGVLLAGALIRPSESGRPGRGGWRPRDRKTLVVVLAVLLIVSAGVAMSSVMVSGRGGDLRGTVRGIFADLGKGSFTWRLARYEEHLPRALERPLLGWGQANWSAANDRTFADPAALGLWLFAFGSFGVVGLVASALIVTLPAAEVLKWLPLRAWLNPGCSALTLSATLLLVNAMDALLNSVVLLPLLACAGGIHSWSERRGRGL